MKKTLITSILFFSSFFVIADDSSTAVRAQGGTGYQINDIRTFEVKDSTTYMIDGNLVPQPNAQGGTGYKIRFNVSDASPNLLTGTLDSIDFINIYKGTIQSLNPFIMFNIEGLTTNDTYIHTGNFKQDLMVGDSVLVSGFIDNSSSSIITRIEKVDSLLEWKLSGYVENLSGNQFSINNQLINFSPNDIGLCHSSLANQQFVEVFATPIVDFQINDTINTVTEINCVDRRIVPEILTSTVIIEGFIDALDAGGNFVLSGQNFEVDQNTKYIRGRAEDMQERIKIEVEGEVDANLGVVFVDKIRFLENRINLTLPVEPNQINFPYFNVAGVSLKVPPQVLDPDGVIAEGITKTTQIQFKGYDYGEEELVVTRINVRGSVDYDGVSLDGRISAIAAPTIHVFGVTLDTTTSTFFDNNGIEINASEFFGMIALDTSVEVSDASLDSNSGLLFGGNVSIELLTDDKKDRVGVYQKGNSQILGVAHITGLSDAIFKGGFE